MFRKPLAMALSIALALGLSPAVGIADDGGADLTAGSVITAQASTASVWVRSGIKGQAVNLGSSTIKFPTIKYTYNKNGLLTKVAGYWITFDSKLGTLTTTYKYNSDGMPTKKVVTQKSARETKKETTTCTYNSKGLLTKTKRKTNTTYDKDVTTTFKYDSQGRVSSKTVKDKNTTVSDGNKNRDTRSKYTYAYNGNGLITSVKSVTEYYNGKQWVNWGSSQTSYSYDAQGNVKSAKDASGTTKYSYSYKSGLVSAEKVKNPYGTNTNKYQYEYKKLSIPVKYEASVRQQQSDMFKPSATGF